jgi:ribonuclease D
MKSKLNELRLDAGIARIEKQQWLCVLDKETGMMIDPMIGLEKFAELVVRECIDTAFHKGHPDLEFLLKHFGVDE